jgi:hypothetical protein
MDCRAAGAGDCCSASGFLLPCWALERGPLLGGICIAVIDI